ncbi:type II toxin-antitoxin system death-on-curing family toxin [Cytophagaceae bacterium DM2B3-1]|uniref:Type II toxin-antitoxin system death-on-curing family toxin n=2 Tax=Xanthocytophaga TaxID=3078918 RepID=A0AAE3QVB1_9BACT|nr:MULTISPECIES: type II toxin-antitoxin system death-on-curing family toxin [Xanthocytophaga]MDJ1469799.1 type II toxin-antitoxin system death-on-curing family toxin [Xanthocytophaga flavus]MDJ1483203.1 type II toxin-antitoxin system death-on-curing family toxin [Xanthocytophaga flavus]MDJ1494312.1 type II toxin-antitoxin system death-on-curing family toxin [Xanthocytophaga flavus]MDJ1503277.1 type II toxin-antitoxin system death-on-curing family toxin [Xanthocytophaga agilis]
MLHLSKKQIIAVNKHQTDRFGGNFALPCNFLNEERLDYLLEVVCSEIFGEPIYPEIYQKAGVYMFSIVSNHIFSDGNKRTGLQSAMIFLLVNGYKINPDLPDQVLIDFTLEVASGKYTLERLQKWFKEHIVKATA